MDITSKEQLEKFVIKNWNGVNHYIDNLSENMPMPLYSSVDIRESASKFSPVDCNIYPAGFNHICMADLRVCAKAFKEAIGKRGKGIEHLGIVPESNTRNTLYLDHLVFLGQCLKDAGFKVSYISFDDDLFPVGQSVIELQSYSKFKIKFQHKLPKEERPDVIILNNDQSASPCTDWEKINIPVLPPPQMGWFQRNKGRFLHHYQKMANLFCQNFSIEPALIQAHFTTEDKVDFATKEGLERIAKKVDYLLEQGGIEEVFVKADRGTYGMGISVVKSGKEIINMNRKKRNKMDRGKNKVKFTSVVIQECVETILQYNGMSAEVAIYLIEGIPQGGFIRANTEKDARSNLNSQGLVFKKYCISEIRQNRNQQSKESIYSVIARLATLATAYEIKELV